MTEKAPVGDVGGPQESGPWPKNAKEIGVGNKYQRPVELEDGTVQEVVVNVTNITDLGGGGYVVEHHFDDPTYGGGE